MATLAQIVEKKVGKEDAVKLIQDGQVKVNGEIDKDDHLVFTYDIIEFNNSKICYLGFNQIVEETIH